MQPEQYRSTLLVAAFLAAATLTGFLRQAAIANQFGAARSTDIFLVAFAVPEFVFNALLVIIPSAFIPLFIQRQQTSGSPAAWRFMFRVAGAILASLVVLLIFTAVGLPTVVRWLAPGFSQSESLQSVEALWRMLPAIPIMGLALLAGSTLQVFRRFSWAVIVTIVYNTTFIVLLMTLPIYPLEVRAAWCVTAGAGAALLSQLPALWRSYLGSSQREASFGAKLDAGPEVMTFMKMAGPLLAGYGIHHLILFIDRAMASTLAPGSVAALNYSYHLALAIGQLSGLAVSMVIFPALSEQINGGDLKAARRSVLSAVRLVFMVALPASAGLILLRVPIVQLLFEHGAFDRSATLAVSLPLAWYAVAVLSDAVCQPLWRVIYANRSPWIMFGVNGLQTGVRLVLNILLIPYFGYVGLAISAAVGLFIQALFLGWLVSRMLHFRIGTDLFHYFAKLFVATGFAIGIAFILSQFFTDSSPQFTLVVTGTPGILTYLISLQFLKRWRSSKVDRGKI
jgi:putative peptidoglycan lipid II flippase